MTFHNTIRDCLAIAALLGLVALPGCVRTRTVYVPPGEPVRIAETIPDAAIWTVGEDGRPVRGTMDIPAGWYALPDEQR